MVTPILAMPPPGVVLTSIIGIALALTGAIAFAGMVIRRPVMKRPDGGRRRGLRLAALAVAVGPLLGLVLGGLVLALGDVHPLDRGYTLRVLGQVGLIAGLAVAGAIALGTLATRRPTPPLD